MIAIASKIIICLILALLLGMIIGYLLCKLFCQNEQNTANEEDPSGKPKPVAKESVSPDNLKKIKGVGEKIELALNDLGVYTFAQIAAWDEKNIKWVDEYLVFKGRIQRDNWVEQAKLLSEGKDTEFSKRFQEK